jgi:TonB family protein
MRILLSFIPLLFYHIVSGQTKIDTIYYDINWQKCSKDIASYFRITRNINKNIIQINDYYLDGKLQMQGQYKSLEPEIRTGDFTFYYENGMIKSKCRYNNNKLVDTTFNYFNNASNSLKEMLTYNNDKLHGNIYTYYQNGQIKRKETYLNDSLLTSNCYGIDGNDTLYYKLSSMPLFNKGVGSILKFLGKHLVYPDYERKNNIEGRILVKFDVTVEGKINNVRILENNVGSKNFENEANRIIQMFPDWSPALFDGEPVEMSVTIPFSFILVD